VHRAAARACLRGHQQVQREARIQRLGLSEDPDDVDVLGRFDLLLEDLTRIRVIGGVAGDPTVKVRYPGDRSVPVPGRHSVAG